MENVFFKSGITQNQIKELIRYSKTDEKIKTNTNDPIRFANITSFKKWKKVPRKIYTLADNLGSLLGIIWFRPQSIPSNKNYIKNVNMKTFGITFALRMYGNARGKGYSKTFLKKAFERYLKTKQFLNTFGKKIWIETNADNKAAIKVYESFGFKIVSKPDEIKRVIMIQS